jgi:hypothetical protein
MQSALHPIPRSSLLAVCVMLVTAISLLTPATSGAQSSPVPMGIKQCRHRFEGKGRKKRQAERRCIKNARSKQRPKQASPTEAPSAAPASPGAPISSAAPTIGGETVVPPDPSTPTGPSAPEAPAPIELELPTTGVVAGSAIYLNPPHQLTSVSAIESTTGAEPGVTVQIEEGRLVISASAEAEPALLHLVIGGTACTGSECGRRVLMYLRLTVQPTVDPMVEVDPNGPTSGPAGYGLQVFAPTCQYLSYGFGNGSSVTVKTTTPREAFDIRTPPTLSTGPHQLWFECLTGRGGPSVWQSEGFEITVTGPSTPIGLVSTTVASGGELAFTTGPSLGAAQCPTLQGVSVDELLLDLYPSSGAAVNHRNVPLPDGLATEGLVVPPGSAAGTYSVYDGCTYANVAGERASYEFAGQPGEITVTAG